MKNKVLIIISFLLLLFIPTIARAEDSSEIEVKSISFVEKSEKTEILSEAELDGINIRFNLKFYDEGDSATYKIVLKNNSEFELAIDENSLVSQNEYIDYNFKFNDGSKMIGSGKEKELSIKISYKKDAPSILFRSSMYDASNRLEVSLGDNFISIPNTLKNLGVFGSMAILVTMTLIGAGIYFLIKNKRVSAPSVLTIIFMLIVIPRGVKAANIYIVPINSNITIQSVTPTTCTFTGDLVQGAEYRLNANSQYIYRYQQEGGESGWTNISNDGWGVILANPDSTANVTETLCSTINGKPIVSMSYMFRNTQASKIDLSSFVTDNVLRMNNMFSGAGNVTELDFRTFNTEKVTNMSSMFANCSSLTEIVVRQFVTSNLTSYSGMFSGASSVVKLNVDGWDVSHAGVQGDHLNGMSSLKEITAKDWVLPAEFANWMRGWGGTYSPIEKIDVTGWDLTNTTNISGLFAESASLKEIVGLDTWDTSHITNISSLFDTCSSVTSLDLSEFDLSAITASAGVNNVFKNTNKLVEIITPKEYPPSVYISLPKMFFYKDEKIVYYSLGNSSKKQVKIECDGIAVIGSSFNGTIRRLANPGVEPSQSNPDSNIYRILVADEPPEDTSPSVYMPVQYYASPMPIYAWYDNHVIYLYTEAKEIQLPEYSNNLFSYLTMLQEVEFKSFKADYVNDMGSMFNYTGSNLDTFDLDISDLDTSHVKYFSYMFKNAGENCNTFKLDLSTLNTENAMSYSEFLYRAAFNAKTVELKGFSNLNFDNNPSVSSMMYYFADKAEDIELDMTNIDLSKVTSYYYMFADMLHHGKNVKVDFSGMKLSDQGDLGSMFSYFAGGAKGLHFIMNDVDVENRTSLSQMFNSVARDYSSDVTIEVKNWNVKNIERMDYMFNYIANDCKNYVKIDLSGWNPENLKNTERMFNGVGNYIGEYDNYNGYVEIKGYSNWDMSKVTNAKEMFAFIGGYSTTVSLDKITNWEFNNEVNLYYLFNYTGKNATSPIDIGTLNIPAGTTNITQLFNGARSMKAVVNIYGNPTNYSNAFSDASSTCGGITVNYSNSTTNIDSIIGNNTHVTKGELLD